MRYRLLGPLEVEREDTVVELGSPKQRAVLAVLLVNRGRVVSTDRLIDAVWGDDAPPSAMGSLQVYISNLRRALRADGAEGAGPVASPIVRQAPGYLLDVPAELVDVAQFRALADSARQASAAATWNDALTHAGAALALWRGPFLDDLRDEDWVRLEATGLEELRTECRETRVTALLALGQLAPALVEVQQLRAEHPLREHSAWLHLLLLHRSGRSAEALQALRDHAARLDEELGLEPGSELRDLQTAILRQDPALGSWPSAPGTGQQQGTGLQQGGGRQQEEVPDAGSSVAPSAALEPSPQPAAGLFVGRRREVELIDRLLDDVRAGRPRWVVLSGPAGIGKSRLAQEMAIRLAGAQIWARCPEEDGAPAWWPMRQVVRGLGADPDVVLVPPPGVESDEARFVVYERVLRLIEDATRQAPNLTIVVDDVQWADPTSLRCLAYLAGALQDRPVALVATRRDGEGGSAAEQFVGAVVRSDGNLQIAVPALSAVEVSALASHVAGAEFSAEQGMLLAYRTGGNPLFVSEYARLPAQEREGEGVPMAVRSVLGRRLAGLEPAVLQVLRAAAVIGDGIEVDLLAAVTGLDIDSLADLLDAAADERIIVAAPGSAGYRFAHGLLREEVLAGLPTIRRQRLHARVAEVLIGSPCSDRLSRRAQHLVSALPLVDPAQVLAACRAAAEDATERWSSETAAQWWEAALQAYDLLPAAARAGSADSDRDDLLVARVEALAQAGRGQTVLDVVEEGLLDAVREGRTSAAGRLAASLLRTAGAWPWAAYGHDPGPLLQRLIGIEPQIAADPAARVRVMTAVAVGSIYGPGRGLPERLSSAALELAEELGDPEVLADALLGRITTFIGVSEYAVESVELGERLNALPHRQSRLDAVILDAQLTMPWMILGRVDEAAEAVRRGIAGSDLLRLPTIRVQMRWMTGVLHQWRGEFAQAEQAHAVAADVHRKTELHDLHSTDLADYTMRWERGDLAALDGEMHFDQTAWQAAVAAARGETALAGDLVTAWLDESRPAVWTTLGHQVLLAHVAADIGLAARAPQLIALLEPHRDRICIMGQVGEMSGVAIALARLRHLLGDDAGARADLAVATDLAARTGGAPLRARCQLLAGRLESDPSRREELLIGAAREAGRLGLGSVQRDAELLLAQR